MQPSNRPAGSSHILRYTGTFQVGVANAVFPKTGNAQVSSDQVAGAGNAQSIRLLLADSTDITDLQKTFPDFVYDDGVPAGSSPHAPVVVPAATELLNKNELDISLRTWCQNTYVTVTPISSPVSPVTSPGFFNVAADVQAVVLDAPNSGLGGNTGLPVLVIGLRATAPIAQSIDLDIVVEIRQSASR